MAPRAVAVYTPEEYLELERKADHKSEYLAGQITAMAGCTKEHNIIATNTLALLWSSLRGKPCRPFSSDMRLRAGGLYTYPDVSVVCGEQRFQDSHVDTLLNPVLIVEVLSPSTELYDRDLKFARYRQIATLCEYVLISQERPHVERHARQQGDLWTLEPIDGLDARVTFESIGVELALADIYEEVPLPAGPPETGAGS